MLFNRQAKSLRKGALCLAAICLATLGASAQQRTITISNKADGNNSLSVSVSQAMEAIESQTDFQISYNKNQLDTSRILVLKSATVPMDELLQSIADGAGVRVMMQGNYIAFVPDNDDFRRQASSPVPRSAAESAPASEQPVAPATTESAKPFYSDFRSLDSYNALQNGRPRLAGTGTFQVQAQTPTQNPNGEASLPRWNIKTNLLYDATATINLGVEFRTGAKTSINIPFNYNAWKFSETRQWRHFLVQPEFRLWTREAFDGHFFGAHAHYAYYNVGNLPHGPFSEYMKAHRFEGWLAGAGISYGYRWNFNRWLGLEATIGVGYAYMDYDKFECRECGANLGSETKHYFGPTKAGLSLVFGIGGKKTPTPQPVVPLYVTAPEPEPKPEPKQIVIYEPTFTSSFVTPEAEAVKARSETGKAYLDFAAGQSEITPNFKNNASELHKMNALIKSVCSNSDATITSIVISGYASPEGTYSANVKLSERRALALRNYIGSKHALPQRLFSAYGVGEDWAGLETLVEQSDLPQREQALAIIRSTGIFDGRERQLMDMARGATYRQMKVELFPQLRRVEYRIDYTVIPFTIEQGKEVMKTRPGDLSLNEMFLIANSYVPGSEEFNEVFETAARVFPDSDVANLNAATIALNRKDADSATSYLAKVKTQDAAYWNNLGMLQWLQGDKTAAAESFDKAGALGTANALELDRHLQTTTAN